MFATIVLFTIIVSLAVSVTKLLWGMIATAVAVCATIATIGGQHGMPSALYLTVKLLNSKVHEDSVLNLKPVNALHTLRSVERLFTVQSMMEVSRVWSLYRPFCKETKGCGLPVDFALGLRIRVLRLMAIVAIICILT
jgi:hypothetical protein